MILTYNLSSLLLSEPLVTCVEAGGAFDDKTYLCEGLDYPARFTELLQYEALFLVVFSSILTIFFAETANKLMDKFYRRKQR